MISFTLPILSAAVVVGTRFALPERAAHPGRADNLGCAVTLAHDVSGQEPTLETRTGKTAERAGSGLDGIWSKRGGDHDQ